MPTLLIGDRVAPIMKAFVIGVVVAIALAVGAAICLNLIQETAAQAYSSSATRLDEQEDVNEYGR
jgi:hypothetical protein